MTKKEYAKHLIHYPMALNVKEVADLLRVSTKTVYNLIQRGEIPAVKVGRAYRLTKTALIDYLRKQDQESSHPKYVISDNSRSQGWISEQSCDIVPVAKGDKE